MLQSLKSFARRIVRPPLHRPEIQLDHDVLGTDYGAWPLLRTLTPRAPLIYSFGIGEDISFDLGAIERYGATVHAFDPTPRCLTWIEGQNLPASFHFHPIGLSDADGDARFFAPEKVQNVSFSAAPARESDPALAVSAPVKRLETIIGELGTPNPDVLKMDIEGFEYAVLGDVIASGIKPPQLLIEFHQRMYDIPDSRTLAAIEDLRTAGYAIFYVSASGHEYGLVHQNLLVNSAG